MPYPPHLVDAAPMLRSGAKVDAPYDQQGRQPAQKFSPSPHIRQLTMADPTWTISDLVSAVG
jgi:hypothetical protein